MIVPLALLAVAGALLAARRAPRTHWLQQGASYRFTLTGPRARLDELAAGFAELGGAVERRGSRLTLEMQSAGDHAVVVPGPYAGDASSGIRIVAMQEIS